MKKILSLIVCFIAAISLIVCDSGTEPSQKSESALTLEISLPKLIVNQDSTNIDVRCGALENENVVWKQDVDISLSVTGGEVLPNNGKTAADGYFSTVIHISTGSDSIIVAISALQGNTKKDTTLVAYIAYEGLNATYTTDTETFTIEEGPIFHGYWSECDKTENNIYQGKCRNLASLPVNWAWGNFTVRWEGYLYVPENGEYHFGSHYWVDGDIYVEINGNVIGDLDTPGGGFGQTISLEGGNWVPIYMTFASNGGSNNMQITWTRPGMEWEIIPKEYLAHR